VIARDDLYFGGTWVEPIDAGRITTPFNGGCGGKNIRGLIEFE
jgi:hypothetical protein